MAKLIYITGGARSGKSSFAEQQAARYKKVAYIATAKCTDQEMAVRINRHRQQRPAHWQTIEEQYQPYVSITESEADAILLDCLSIWVSNLVLQYWDDQQGFLCSAPDLIDRVLSEVEKLVAAAAVYQGTLIIVSNEVGSGIVPVSPLARLYRDCLGLCNQKIAASADLAYWCVSGIPVLLKEGGHEK